MNKNNFFVICALALSNPSIGEAQSIHTVQNVEVNTNNGVCPAGNITQIQIKFITNGSIIQEDELKYVSKTGQYVRLSNIEFDKICLDSEFMHLENRFKTTKDNLIASHNLCVSKAALYYRELYLNLAVDYLDLANESLYKILYLSALHKKYAYSVTVIPKFVEQYADILKFSKDFPNETAESISALGAGGAVAEDFANDLENQGISSIISMKHKSPYQIIENYVDLYYKLSDYDFEVDKLESYSPCTGVFHEKIH